jgi:hypothetical protein
VSCTLSLDPAACSLGLIFPCFIGKQVAERRQKLSEGLGLLSTRSWNDSPSRDPLEKDIYLYFMLCSLFHGVLLLLVVVLEVLLRDG